MQPASALSSACGCLHTQGVVRDDASWCVSSSCRLLTGLSAPLPPPPTSLAHAFWFTTARPNARLLPRLVDPSASVVQKGKSWDAGGELGAGWGTACATKHMFSSSSSSTYMAGIYMVLSFTLMGYLHDTQGIVHLHCPSTDYGQMHHRSNSIQVETKAN